ncbi:MAG TPA: NYN domain-containing protein [Actinomycetota bacterium]|nr:NYN domain-containing protein [Actinomycetota bacterium]
MIDAQNCYRDARRAFHQETDPSSFGQVDPWKLGQLVASRGAENDTKPRELEVVRYYTGMPSSAKQPKAYGAHLKQRAAHLASGVEVRPRPLRYPADWPKLPAQEKGIDVALAVDLVFGAARRLYDVGVVVSTDTDLVPALEAVCELQRAWGTPTIEVVSWGPTRKRLRVDGYSVWCHWLDKDDYESVRDNSIYVSKEGRK